MTQAPAGHDDGELERKLWRAHRAGALAALAWASRRPEACRAWREGTVDEKEQVIRDLLAGTLQAPDGELPR